MSNPPPRPARKRSPAANIAELLVTIVVIVGLALLVQAFVIKPYQIPSGSMIPTLRIHQRILVDRLDTRPALGSVVVFHPPVGADYSQHECGDPDAGAGYAIPCDRAYPVASSQVFVKRIVGLPGDRIQIRDGIVYRNGRPERLPYSQGTAESASGYVSCSGGEGTCSFARAITVPAGDYYMMGDNRGNSDDSRYWGPVPQRWIIGKAIFTYWPLDRVGIL